MSVEGIEFSVSCGRFYALDRYFAQRLGVEKAFITRRLRRGDV